MKTGTQLVCHHTLPANRSFIFQTILGHDMTVERGDIERIPITIPDQIADRMAHVSQLGLKNSYLKLEPGEHVRWSHACGTYTVGSLWLIALYRGERIPKHLTITPYPTFQAAQILAGYALLLHDYGHLFFSHLLEDALKDINWIPADHGLASLEYTVLRNRLYTEEANELVECISQSIKSLRPSELVTLYQAPLDLVTSLMNGRSGLTWIQAIVNSPIDADKIDYIRRDQGVLTESADYPIRTRLNFGPSRERWPWFEEFISEQYVNHTGFLCLPGRSALAAGDLWRERLFLYERFYLSPEVRAADRMALELIQQFLIRCVMSEGFADLLRDPKFLDKCRRARIAEKGQMAGALQRLRGLSEAVYSNKEGPMFDIINVKYEITTQILSDLSDILGTTSKRDWECLQLMTLALRQKTLRIEGEYAELLKEAWKRLWELKKGKTKLSTFGRDCIIGSIQFRRQEEKAVREVFRAFQHEHSGDLLVDISVVPLPLSMPLYSAPSRTEEQFARILVPKGPIERWTLTSHDLQPLTAVATRSLEHPLGTIVLLSPKPLSRSRKLYLFDRALAVAERHAFALEVHSDA